MPRNSKRKEESYPGWTEAGCLCVMAVVLSGCAIGSPIWNATIEPWTGIHAAESQAELDANRAQRRVAARERELAYRELQDSQARSQSDLQRSQKQKSTCVIHFQDTHNVAVTAGNVRLIQDSYHESFGNGNDFRFSTSDVNGSKPLEIRYTWNGKPRTKKVYATSGTGVIKVTVN